MTQSIVRTKYLSLTATRAALSLTILFAIILLCSSVSLFAAPKSNSAFRPKVLVLIMGNQNAQDLVSVNYTSVVPLATAQADLDKVAALGGWSPVNAKGETRASGGPEPVDSTSISYQAQVLGYDKGTLPIEPFITALKRFELIEIDYLTPAAFQFNGLQDYEDKYVKIELQAMGTHTYRYRITVKNAGFTKLDLPLTQPAEPVEAQQAGRTIGQRLLLGLLFGLGGALVVYILTTVILRRRSA
ncbi:MAG: hypothetical protein ACOX3G_11460 [Armatimonadota bacterium]